jgi:hypothetical protein
LFLSHVDVSPAVLPAGPLISLSGALFRSPDPTILLFSRCSARRIALREPSCRDFAYTDDKSSQILQKACLLKDFAAAPHARSLISLTHPPRTILDRSFLSLADALTAAPLAVSLVSLTGQPFARGAAR